MITKSAEEYLEKEAAFEVLQKIFKTSPRTPGALASNRQLAKNVARKASGAKIPKAKHNWEYNTNLPTGSRIGGFDGAVNSTLSARMQRAI